MPKYAIMLDPGHGGADSGVCGNGLLEKDLNWTVAGFVQGLLNQHGFAVNLSRGQDELPGLDERAQRALDWGADLLISIHHNGGGGIGYEIYHQIQTSIDGQFSPLLASQYQAIGQTPHDGGILTRALDDGSNLDYYGILRESKSRGVPAIISEYAFVDSDDVQKINTDDKLYAEAAAIAHAICDLCGIPRGSAASAPITFEQALALLAQRGIIQSPEYWHNNAVQGKTVNGEYAGALIQKMAEKLI